MRSFGAEVDEQAEQSWYVHPSGYQGASYAIEPDASAASYFFARRRDHGWPRPGRRTRCKQSAGRPGFRGRARPRWARRSSVDDDATTVEGTGALHGVEVDLRDFSDTAQTLAAVAVFADGPTTVTGIGFIRRKETDRIAAVVARAGAAGSRPPTEEPDGFVIHPGPRRTAGVVETYDDHRMAMSFALLGLRVPGIEIADPGCVAKTFPDFFEVLDSLRGLGPTQRAVGSRPMKVIAIDGPAGSGKSTVARTLAERSPAVPRHGAMYRAVTFAALRRGVDPDDAEPSPHAVAQRVRRRIRTARHASTVPTPRSRSVVPR